MRVAVQKQNGREYLKIVKSYRGENGIPRNKHIKRLGYLDELVKDYPDPVAHFRQVAKEMTDDEKAGTGIILRVDMKEELLENSPGVRNLGYILPMKIYYELEIDKFLNSKSQYKKIPTCPVLLLAA